MRCYQILLLHVQPAVDANTAPSMLLSLPTLQAKARVDVRRLPQRAIQSFCTTHDSSRQRVPASDTLAICFRCLPVTRRLQRDKSARRTRLFVLSVSVLLGPPTHPIIPPDGRIVCRKARHAAGVSLGRSGGGQGFRPGAGGACEDERTL